VTLAGRTVLVPRGGAWGERVRADLRRRGATGIVAPLVMSAPPRDIAGRDRIFAALAGGEYAWLFVTSAAAVEQLAAHSVAVPPRTRIAAVGRATARAVADAGFEVSFVPDGHSSAAAMIGQWCAQHEPDGRCLVLRSDLATAVVSDELELRGHDVDVCIGYRTVGVDLPAEVLEDLRSGRIDVVLLTSLSVGRELRRQAGDLPASTLVASIGPGTTRDGEALGYRVGWTARTQSIDALLAELDERSEDRP
jgi:uroporphyrinogen-III synthase